MLSLLSCKCLDIIVPNRVAPQSNELSKKYKADPSQLGSCNPHNNAAGDSTWLSMLLFWLLNISCSSVLCIRCIKYALCFSLFFVCHRENLHSPMNLFHVIFSGLLDLDPLPVSLCYEYITKTHVKNNFIWGKNTRLNSKDKDGWGRPWYYQAALFISRFRKKWK